MSSRILEGFNSHKNNNTSQHISRSCAITVCLHASLRLLQAHAHIFFHTLTPKTRLMHQHLVSQYPNAKAHSQPHTRAHF